MKRNILHTAVLFSALAFASCSTPNKLASTPDKDDDVYFTKAEAAEAPVYRQPVYADRYTNVDQANGDDDDYYYYDSYASRINRFGYSSPFDYYDDYYYGYNNPYAYNSFGYGGLAYGGYGGLGYGYGGFGYGGLGIGLGWGGYGGGFGYGLGYGYGGLYSPYSYWGTGLGYGGPYWGVYSAYGNVAKARPYRGSGYPTNYGTGAGRNSSVRSMGYNGAYGNAMGSPVRRPSIAGAYGNSSYNGGNSSYNGGRPSRGSASPQPVYRPQRTEVNRPEFQPATMDRGSSAGSMGSSGGGGGGGSRGGGRPSRP